MPSCHTSYPQPKEAQLQILAIIAFEDLNIKIFMKILNVFFAREWPDDVFKVQSSGRHLKKQFLPSPADQYVCSQSVYQGNALSRMPCRRSCTPILQHILVFYFPLESGTNLWMHVRGIYDEALDSLHGKH